jgi:hypothetical protein
LERIVEYFKKNPEEKTKFELNYIHQICAENGALVTGLEFDTYIYMPCEKSIQEYNNSLDLSESDDDQD